ncbi:MAG: protein translocase subunit SecD [Planctomycetota bacterium]|jgi:SecD/SecF fusion protein
MFECFLNFVLAQAAQGPALGSGDATATNWQSLMDFGLFLLAVIIPFVLGKLVSNGLKMPSHAMAFSWILLAMIATGIVLATGTLRLGPDIKGGTNLIYQIDPNSLGNTGTRVSAKEFIAPLSKRINRSGMNESVIRPRGLDQIEIIIAAVDAAEIDDIKNKITSAGILQFRIVANQNDHEDLIKAARAQSEDPSADVRLRSDVFLTNKATGDKELAGIWRKLGRGADNQVEGYQLGDTIRNGFTGQILTPVFSDQDGGFERWLEREKIQSVDILLALQRNGTPYVDVKGADLARAKAAFGKSGNYEVEFTMTTGGAEKMLKLTGTNQPDPNTGFKRRMAILLDNEVLSSPNLNSPIRGEGVIQGSFTLKQVEFLVGILNAGSLPGAISKEPVSQHVIGASMGVDAITKGKYASALGLVTTVLCVLAYYRFSGLVATLALALNLAMIVACMMLFQQPLTLPGLAGLVLSVGMSVDANVLVFERMREERQKNATPRMAIRNGFDRAWTTIFDSNLTTLISAAVLYYVGTEQIKGFAITLIIGLAISMFTAVFFAHKLFEVAERWNVLSLGMSDWVNSLKQQFFGEGVIRFFDYRKVCYAISALLILIGLVATFLRGREFLDIDFNGGTSVVFVLDRGVEPDKVRSMAEKAFELDEQGLPIQSTLTNVEMNEFPKNSVYKLDVSLKDEKQVRERLLKGFTAADGAALVTYDMNYQVTKGDQSRRTLQMQPKYVSLQDPAAVEPAPLADTPPTDAPPTDAAPSAEATTLAPTVFTSAELNFNATKGSGGAKLNAAQVIEALIASAQSIGRTLVDAQVELQPVGASDWKRDSRVGYETWKIKLPFDAETTTSVLNKMQEQVRGRPVFQSFSKIEGRVAGEMQQRAIAGLLLSLVFITIYIWFRFNKVSYGIAAVIALVHDVLITIAFLAVSHWLFRPLGFLMIEDFKISLTIVAAILTIIGYSLNDTIVVFDRIREVKGKSPNLTEDMVNKSVTQTLSRTLLTSSTTIIAILLMYIWGGEGIHGFAFCLLVGIVVGTFSSIFVASPVLLWLERREQAARLAAKVS